MAKSMIRLVSSCVLVVILLLGLSVISARYVQGSATAVSSVYKPVGPSSPEPADGAVEQAIDVILSWEGSSRSPMSKNITYKVYLEAGDSTPDELVCDGASTTTCDPGTLEFDTQYYWQVVADYVQGRDLKGPVWTFTTTIGDPDCEIDLDLNIPDVVLGDATIDGTATSICSTVTHISWDWGDGTSDDQWFPANHTYVMSDTYYITVTAYGDVNNSTTATTGVIIGRQFASEMAITTTAYGAIAVDTADLDGDGDEDVMAVSNYNNQVDGYEKIEWFENTSGDGSTWTTHLIDSFWDAPVEVKAADLDADGDIDFVVGAHDHTDLISWFDNDGNVPPSFTERTVIQGYGDGGYADIEIVDMDGDNDLDMVVAGSYHTDKVFWLENDGAVTPTFNPHTIDDLILDACELSVADLDADGDLDVVAGSITDTNIIWYESSGGSAPTFTKTVIFDIGTSLRGVETADMNGDDDIDIIVASNDAGIVYLENSGGSEPSFSHIPIPSSTEAYELKVADFDMDGHLDIATVWIMTDVVAWYKNNGDPIPQFVRQEISTSGDYPRNMCTGDVDGDNDIDLLVTSYLDHKVAWYENLEIDITPRVWDFQTVPGTDVHDIYMMGLDVDSSGDPHIVHSMYTVNTIGFVYYHHLNSSGWITTPLEISDNPSWIGEATIDLDGDDNPHVSYKGSNHKPMYGVYTGSTWITETITSDFNAICTAIAVEPEAPYNPHVSTMSYPAEDAVYAYKTGDEWQWENIYTPGTVGDWCEIRVPATAPFTPQVTFHDHTNGYLMYASHNGTSWDVQTLDTGGDPNRSTATSLALDSNGYPHICYAFELQDDLHYVYWDGSRWIYDKYIAHAHNCAIDLDENDVPHIAYRDPDADRLHYLVKNGSSWIDQNLDDTSLTQGYLDIAIGPDGEPHIIYDGLDALRYAVGQ